METILINVTEEGLLIPRDYLPDAQEFELELKDDHIVIRSKGNGNQGDVKPEGWPYEWIGIAETKDPTASQRVEEILAEEIDRRAGWTLDPYPEEEQGNDA